jgi:uncharacterized protein YqgV (UPF0045/DUF77 family)
MALVGEFTIEPFVPGNPGPHVQAAFDAATMAGGQLEIGAFGTEVRADDDAVVLKAVEAAIHAALAAGATRVSSSFLQQ